MRKRTSCPYTLSILRGKVCNKCGLWHDFITSFAPNPKASDGLSNICASCVQSKQRGKEFQARTLRQSRLDENGGHYSRAEFYELCCRYNWQCLACKCFTSKLAADHIVSVVDGGSSDIDNIQPLCKSCNSQKHGKSIDYRHDVPEQSQDLHELTDEEIAFALLRAAAVTDEQFVVWKRIQDGETIFAISNDFKDKSRGTLYLWIRKIDRLIKLARNITDNDGSQGTSILTSNFDYEHVTLHLKRSTREARKGCPNYWKRLGKGGAGI